MPKGRGPAPQEQWWRQLKRYLPDVPDKMNVAPGFHMLPRRCGWVVERTFAWLGRSRRLRLSRDDERLPASSEAIVYVTESGFSPPQAAGFQP